MRRSVARRRWIDATLPLRPGMVRWPSDPPFALRRLRSIARGDRCNLSAFTTGAHAGTHVDAPLHFLRRGRPVDALPLEALVGPCRVIAVRGAALAPEAIARLGVRRGERILLRTANTARRWSAGRGPALPHAALTPAAARLLAARRPRTVGIDHLSVGPGGDDGVAVHRALLGAGVVLIEGLDLSRAAPGRYDLVCLPLRLAGAEGAPARAILRRRYARARRRTSTAAS